MENLWESLPTLINLIGSKKMTLNTLPREDEHEEDEVTSFCETLGWWEEISVTENDHGCDCDTSDS